MPTNRKTIVFCVALLLFVSVEMFEKTAYYALESSDIVVLLMRMLRYLSYLVCCISVLLSSLGRKKLLLILLMSGIIIISYFASANRHFLLRVLFLFSADDVSDRSIIKTEALTQTLWLAVTVVLSMLGVWTDYIFGVTRLRHGLGFSWTTTAPIVYFYILMGLVFLYGKKLSIFAVLMLEGINVFFFVMTNTRFSFVLSTLVLLFVAFCQISSYPEKVLLKTDRIMCCLPVTCCGISFLGAYSYNGSLKWMRSINGLLSDRLRLGNMALSKYGITLFGQPIEWVGNSVLSPATSSMKEYNYVDCSYLQIGLEHGLIVLLLTLTVYTVLMILYYREKRIFAVFVLAVIVMFAITEPRLMNFMFNAFPMLLFSRKDQNTILRSDR